MGDIAYDGVFPWTAETTPAERSAWIAALDAIAARNPTVVIAGHQKPDDKLDTSAIQFTKDYLRAYDEAVSTSKSAAELQAKMKANYPDAALDVILKLGAEAAFKPKASREAETTRQYPSSQLPSKSRVWPSLGTPRSIESDLAPATRMRLILLVIPWRAARTLPILPGSSSNTRVARSSARSRVALTWRPARSDDDASMRAASRPRPGPRGWATRPYLR